MSDDDTSIKVSKQTRERLARLAAERHTTLKDLVEDLASSAPTAAELAERERRARAVLAEHFGVEAAAGRAVLAVPALCLCAAEAHRPGIAEHIGALPVDIEPLDLSATIPVGRLIGEGIDWRIAQAVTAALPSA